VEINRHAATPTSTLLDLLSLTDNTSRAILVQCLSKLEGLQMKIARVKDLNASEERVAEVAEVELLKTNPDNARLAPALSDLSLSIAHFSAFISNLSREDLGKDLSAKYKFFEMATQVEAIQQTEMTTAIDRWHAALESVVKQLQIVLPKDWRPKVIDDFDPEYVKKHILVQTLISGLGSDYAPAVLWLNQLEKNEYVFNAYTDRYGDDLQKAKGMLKDTRDIVACILSYNLIINKWPKAQVGDRRQQLKDLKKKLKLKLGKDFELPDTVATRLQSAESGDKK